MAAFPQLNGYNILERVGVGGMSTVWKALDLNRKKIVAIKILAPEHCTNRDEIDLFIAEEEAMRHITHPGIVKSYALERQGETFFYVMEFVDGYTFGDLLARKQHLCEEDCLLICESVAVALDFAWNEHGIVHCDIKPENLMINSDGIVKLTDLGLCRTFRALKDGLQDVPDHVMGTPAYISPEQIFGDCELDCRADIYSLGATLYHLATGRILFPGRDHEDMMRAHCADDEQAKDPRIYRESLSEGFAQLLEAMLVKNRDFRVQSWRDVREMALDVERGAAFKNRDFSHPSSIRLRV